MNGRRYTILDDNPVAAAPEWLLTLAHKPREASSITDTEITILAEQLDSADPLDAVPEKLQPRLERELKHRDKLKRRWDGDTEGLTDTTRKRVEFSLAAMLSGPFAPEEVGILIRANPPRKPGQEGETVRELARSILNSGCTLDLGSDQSLASKAAAELGFPVVKGSTEPNSGEKPEGEGGLSPEDAADLKERRKKYRGVSPVDAAKLPAPIFWDEEKTLPRTPGEGDITVTVAKPGQHKSNTMLDEILEDLANYPDVRAVMCIGEKFNGVGALRLPALAKVRGITLESLTDRLLLIRVCPDLTDGKEVDAFLAEIGSFRPSIVGIDTLADATAGIDENSTRDMGQAFKLAERIQVTWKASVRMNHHTNKVGEYRGNSVILAKPTCLREQTFDEATGTVTVTVKKQSDGAKNTKQWGTRIIGETMVVVRLTPEEKQRARAKIAIRAEAGSEDRKALRRALRQLGLVDAAHCRSLGEMAELMALIVVGEHTAAGQSKTDHENALKIEEGKWHHKLNNGSRPRRNNPEPKLAGCFETIRHPGAVPGAKPERMFFLSSPTEIWEEMERQIAAAHGDGSPDAAPELYGNVVPFPKMTGTASGLEDLLDDAADVR